MAFIQTFDPLAFLQQGKITSGTYANGYLAAPDGAINWYFANLGLIAFVTKIPSDVLQYMDLYLSLVADDGSIQDTDNDGNPALADSDDSYAARFFRSSQVM